MVDAKVPFLLGGGGRGTGRGQGVLIRTATTPGVVCQPRAQLVPAVKDDVTSTTNTRALRECSRQVPANKVSHVITQLRDLPLEQVPAVKDDVTSTTNTSAHRECSQQIPMNKDNDVISQLRDLPLEVSEDQLMHLFDSVQVFAMSTDQLQLTAQALRDRCNDNWHFAASAACLANRLANLEVDGMKFRSCILTCINQEYTAFETYGKESMSSPKFLGFVSMLSQLFVHLLINDEPIKRIVVPLVTVMETLFESDATDSEMNCGATQLLAIGGILQDLADDMTKSRLSSVIENVRNKIIDSKGTPQTRYLMIDVIEAAASDWSIVNS